MNRAVVIVGSAAVLVGIALGTWVFGRPAYRKHRETSALADAKRFFAEGKLREASLSARQALRFNPSNVEACRLMADMAGQARAPQTLEWRRRVAELSPTVENKLLLARAALYQQPPPFPLAAQVLEELQPTSTNVAGYHLVAAELALRMRRFEEAADRLADASRLEPTNDLHRLNLAVIHLQSTNQAAVAEARGVLEALRSRTNLAAGALRSLVADGVERSELERAERFSRELLALPGVTIEDRLQHLTILKQAKRPEFEAQLAVLQQEASTNAFAVYLTTTWLVREGMADGAMRWISNCPPAIRAEQPVPLGLVDCYVANGQWEGLEAYLQGEQWGDVEFLRYAFLSRAAWEQKHSLAAETRWRSALREAGARLDPLVSLLKLATSWGRDQAKESLLWHIAERFPREQWALKELDRLYVSTGNTAGLHKLYSTLAESDPESFVIKNNLAAISLLLKRNVPKAQEMAREVHTRQPENPLVATTYVLALLQDGKNEEARAVLDKFGLEALAKPPLALYYGLVLAALGENAKAVAFLEAGNAPDLLPEERELLAGALRQAASRQ